MLLANVRAWGKKTGHVRTKEETPIKITKVAGQKRVDFGGERVKH